jgi:hypothetical protein
MTTNLKRGSAGARTHTMAAVVVDNGGNGNDAIAVRARCSEFAASGLDGEGAATTCWSAPSATTRWCGPPATATTS